MKLIAGTKKQKPDNSMKFLDLMVESGVNRHKEPNNRQHILRYVFYGVKYFALPHVGKTNADILDARVRLSYSVKAVISLLTPRELMRVFPIQKTYDGERYGCKDYFFTMDVLKKHGLDNPIGEAVEDILWDYVNPAMVAFGSQTFCDVADFLRINGERDVLKEFCAENGIATYSMSSDGKGKRFLTNNDTGEVQRVKRPRPRHLKVVKK